jgi:hypothetical protein
MWRRERVLHGIGRKIIGTKSFCPFNRFVQFLDGVSVIRALKRQWRCFGKLPDMHASVWKRTNPVESDSSETASYRRIDPRGMPGDGLDSG